MFGNSRYLIQKLKTISYVKGNPIFSKKYNCLIFRRLISCQNYCTDSSDISRKIEFDYEYLCDKANTDIIRENIVKRKSTADIDKVISLWETLKHKDYIPSEKQKIENQLYIESLKIPNKCSPHLHAYRETPHLIRTYNEKPAFKFKPREFHDLVQYLNFMTMDGRLSKVAGPKTYIFNSSLANLERALIRYCITFLLEKGFTLYSVPDLLYSHVFDRCGMQTRGTRSQVYRLSNFENEDVRLSGTAEMSIAGSLQDREIHIKDLPLKIAAVSRCYRQETSQIAAETGIFRVHQFNKVEMFGVTANESGDESNQLYEELINIQTELYSALNIFFQVLEMPMCDLGDQAYVKTDIEAWIPVQKIFGEISSTSNCIDYQSRRLNLRYKNQAGDVKFAHTINGTACAIPRMLISLVASNQTAKGTILVPKALQPFLGLEVITRTKHPVVVSHFNTRSYKGSILKLTDMLEADSA